MPDKSDLVRAMAWRAIQEIQGLSETRDYNLISLLMEKALAHEYSFDNLEAFRGARRINCFGFFRDATHYAGMCRIQVNAFRTVSGIMVQTTGPFAGIWAFFLNEDTSVMTSRDGDGVTEVHGLEGPDLIDAVVASSLTEALSSRPPRRWWWQKAR